jgi:hypothetical protein
MVFNATFNNISVILWRGVLLEETGVLEEISSTPASTTVCLNDLHPFVTDKHNYLYLVVLLKVKTLIGEEYSEKYRVHLV